MSQGGAERVQPLRLPVGDRTRAEFEANPASPILRFSPGHSLDIGGLFAGKPTGAGKTGIPLEYVKDPSYAQDGKITSYTLELTGEELAQMVITASADPSLQTAREASDEIIHRRQDSSPIRPMLRLPAREVKPSNSLVAKLADIIEWELANGSLTMQDELMKLDPENPALFHKEVTTQRLQFLNGLQALQQTLRANKLQLGLSTNASTLVADDRRLIPGLMNLLNPPVLPPEVAALIDAEDLAILRNDDVGLIFQATNPTGPQGRLTVEQILADIERQKHERERRINEIIREKTQPMRAIPPRNPNQGTGSEPGNGGRR